MTCTKLGCYPVSVSTFDQQNSIDWVQFTMFLQPASYVCRHCILRQSVWYAGKFRFQSTGIFHHSFAVDPAADRYIVVSTQNLQSATLGRLPGGLLRRAQELSKEHRLLESNLSEEYNKKTATRVGQIAGVSRALKEYEDAINVCSFYALSINPSQKKKAY